MGHFDKSTASWLPVCLMTRLSMIQLPKHVVRLSGLKPVKTRSDKKFTYMYSICV